MNGGDVTGWVDEDGYFWPDDGGWEPYGYGEDVDAVNKGKGKGSVQCFNCGEFGHISRDCKKPRIKGKGKGK